MQNVGLEVAKAPAGESDASQLASLEATAAEARRLTEERNALIRDLREQGVSLRVIADAAGLSHTAIAKVVAAHLATS